MNYSAFIFDFDYTLGDSTRGICESTNYALRKMGLAVHTTEEISKTVGMSLPVTFTYLTGIDDNEKGSTFRKLFIEKADEMMTDCTDLFPDTIKVLSDIKNNGNMIGILTTKIHRRIESILNKFGLSEITDIIIGADDVKNLKPDPEGLLAIMDSLKIDKKDLLYIGDTVIDAKTAKSAGVDFFGITTGTTGKDELSAYPNVGVTKNLEGFYKAVFSGR